jgi:GH43 family beta-xylosidase
VHHTFSPGVRQWNRSAATLNAHPFAWPRGRHAHVARTHVVGDVLNIGAVAEAELLLPAPSQDPQVVFVDGQYHYCESTSAGIYLRSAPSLSALGAATKRLVWKAPRTGPCSKNIWAPEVHTLDGEHYIYFAADDGRNANHRMWVLKATSRSIAGPYQLCGCMDTEGWAIDGTVLELAGRRYFVWSGWPGRSNGQQNLYISEMASPVKLKGERVLLARPTRDWERRGMPICEGPQILQHGGRTFLIYSASGSWTADYCLGMLELVGTNPLACSAWRNRGPVFSRNQHACGVGHCGFVTTAHGEHWILYHAKTVSTPGWTDREVRAQRFVWGRDGAPVFGQPGPRRWSERISRRAA